MCLSRKAIAICTLIFVGLCSAGQSQSPGASVEEKVFTVDNPRPLAAAGGLLERKLGIPISYEDPVWAAADDLVSARDLPGNRQRAAQAPDLKWPLVPRGGSVEIRIPINTATLLPAESPQALLERMLQDHMARGNAGEFRIVRFGNDELSIVPSRAKDRTGNLVAQASPLDTHISLPRELRRVTDALDAIIAAIGKAGGGSVASLLVPTAWLEKQEVLLGADNEPARDVLSRALRDARWSDASQGNQPRAKVSYRLMYDPKSKTYVLNLYLVLRELLLRLDKGAGPIASSRTELVFYAER